MHSDYVTLAEWFAPPAQAEAPPEIAVDEPACHATMSATEPLMETVREFKRFRAALADAVDMVLEELLRDIASEVVCRELLLSPVDVHAIVARAKKRYAFDEPAVIRAHPDDCEALKDFGVTLHADGKLRRGDVVLAVQGGTIDATLGARLHTVLAALQTR